jgi:2-methylcitrate dehydratase PrpD
MVGGEPGIGETGTGFREGLAVVPAAVAVAEAKGASGAALLEAIVAGCAAGAACSRVLLPGVSQHGLDPLCAFACFGSAAAAARLLGLDAEATAGAIALAGILMPVAPLQDSDGGAIAGALGRGWAAFAGVQAAHLALGGLAGPMDLLEAPRDGLGTFLLHAPADTTVETDLRELLSALAVADSARLHADFRRLAGATANGVEKAVENLAGAADLGQLSAALGVRP